jgi:dynein light intermediate chain 1
MAESHQSGFENGSHAPEDVSSAQSAYEETIRDPRSSIASNMHSNPTGGKLEIKSQDTQVFLAAQLEALDRIRSSGETGRESLTKPKSYTETEVGEENNIIVESRVNEHIGPIQFNMGGIQVDADDMLKRLKVRVKWTPTVGGIYVCIHLLIKIGPTE